MRYLNSSFNCIKSNLEFNNYNKNISRSRIYFSKMTDRLLWVRSTGKVGAYGDQDSLQHFIMAHDSSSISCTRRPLSERGPTERIRQAVRTSAAAVRQRGSDRQSVH